MIFSKIARNAVLETAGSVDASEYWTNRKGVGEKMKDNLTLKLKDVNCNVTGFMLLVIDLPDRYEASIVDT